MVWFSFLFTVSSTHYGSTIAYIIILQFLLAVSEHYGDSYLTNIMLPVFLVAVGDNASLQFFPPTIQSRLNGKGILNFK